MSDIEKTPREKAEALIGEVLTAVLSAGEITVNQARAVNAALEAALTPPEGYVLVPVELLTAIEDLSLVYEAGGDIDSKLSQVEMLAARPEVP